MRGEMLQLRVGPLLLRRVSLRALQVCIVEKQDQGERQRAE